MAGIEPPAGSSPDADDPSLAEAIRRHVAPLGGDELPPHPPVAIGAPAEFEWPSAEEKAAAVAQAQSLKTQAAEGGLRFEVYLPPELATWLLGLVEEGSFRDPSEAVFVMLGEQRDLEGYPDLRRELFRRTIQAAMDDPRPGFSSEEVRRHLDELFSKPRPEPASWPRKGKTE